MKKLDLLNFQAPLHGGPDMNLRRLAISATQLATALRQTGGRYLREFQGIVGELEDEEPLEEQLSTLEKLLGDEGAQQALMMRELVTAVIVRLDEIQNFSSNTTAQAAAVTAGTAANTRDQEAQPNAGNAPDASASGGAGSTDVSHPTQAAGGGGTEGSGASTTPAAGSDASSTPGSTPGEASGTAAGAGPSSSSSPSPAPSKSGKPDKAKGKK